MSRVEDIVDMLRDNVWLTVGGVVTAGIAVIATRRLFSRPPKPNYPRDTVILRQIGRSRFTPSLSPFPLKLETYLRFAKIPYKNIHSRKMSPKNKTPWIEYNGETYSDSGFIIEFLNEEFNVDLSSHLSRSERAVARAFLKMTEESLFWTLGYTRWVADNSKRIKMFFPNVYVGWTVLKMVVPTVRKALYAQGTGRHTEDEIYSIAEKDIRALSTFLGDKKFLFGDEPCEEDCAIFGMLAWFVWNLCDSPQETLIKGDCKNLQDYCYRMKERFWPDWEQCIMGDDCQAYAAPASDSTTFQEE